MGIEDYHGPDLLVIAHAGKLVTFTAEGRTLADLAPERMLELLDLAIAAEHEPYRPGADTAEVRPITSYHLRAERLLQEHRFTTSLSVNHCYPRALGPRWSALIAGLRGAAGKLPPARPSGCWDFAAAFLDPIDLGPEWAAGGVVRLPPAVAAFEHAGPVYLRVGQPPHQSELYCHDGGLVHVDDQRRAITPTPLMEWHQPDRWLLPCGGGTVMIGHEWQRPPRFTVHAFDPARPIYVQRG